MTVTLARKFRDEQCATMIAFLRERFTNGMDIGFVDIEGRVIETPRIHLTPGQFSISDAGITFGGPLTIPHGGPYWALFEPYSDNWHVKLALHTHPLPPTPLDGFHLGIS